MAKWIKYNERWAAGPGPVCWEYTEDDLEDFAAEVNESNSYSEMYRGCDAEYADPPSEVVVNEVIRQQQIRRSAENTIFDLINTLDDEALSELI